VANIIELLKKFEYILVKHTKQEGNGVADYLANMGWHFAALDIDGSWPISDWEERNQAIMVLLEKEKKLREVRSPMGVGTSS